MGWPKGVPRKPKVAQAATPVPVRESDETKAIPDEPLVNDGVVVSEKNSVDEISVAVYPGRMPSLANRESDPFTKFKTDEKHFAYRAINTRPHLRRQREAEGWTTIPGSEYGDLILAKMPIEHREAMRKEQQDMTKRQSQAATERFKEEAARSGVKTFDEK